MEGKKVGKVFLVMGVSSTGKSSVGQALASAIKAKFIDGDDLHPKANILKMSSGHALNDDDRAPWLERIRDAAFSVEQKGETAVIVCSALKRQYRDQIREGNSNVTFLHLYGEFELVKSRMLDRRGHFMPVSLLQNQFDTLEMPTADEPNMIEISIDGDFKTVLNRCIESASVEQLAPSVTSA
ncbi:gluconokinase [Vibrio aphrogenes]|uniref:gluconokinase n=1 Tax=Vibrio aphrogenes TaxID=1891186 RepID=UPI000B34F47E|nr:gluconokinase [Vibrio aphrogenes]